MRMSVQGTVWWVGDLEGGRVCAVRAGGRVCVRGYPGGERAMKEMRTKRGVICTNK